MKYHLLILLLHLLSLLPLTVCRALGAGLGWLSWQAGSRMRQTTLINLAQCFPGLPEQERAALGLASVQHTMQTIMETGAVWLWPSRRTLALITEVRGFELLQELKAKGKGVIVLAPHLGNWEVLGLYLNACGLGQSYQLYQAPADPALNALILQSRSRAGARMVATDNKGVAELLRALKSGDIAGILPDQVPSEAGGEYAPFYGVPALTMTLLVKLQQKTGAGIVLGFAERVAGGFRINFQAPEPHIYDAHMPASLAAMNISIEALIARAPAQYQWEYKRFRRQPPGKPAIYPR